jgi:hypothetical protein
VLGRSVLPSTLFVLSAAALVAGCGADARRNDSGSHGAVASARRTRTGGPSAKRTHTADPPRPARPTVAQEERCQTAFDQQFAVVDSFEQARARLARTAARDTGRSAAGGAGSAGRKPAPEPQKPRYATGDDPFFAVKMGWPTKTPAPLAGGILPCHRIVAYYGNPYSRKMGVLGEYPYPEMIQRFRRAIAMWNAADPEHPVQPALQLITVVAQGDAGKDGMYRLRMPNSLIDKVYGWARQEHALFIMDVQVGKSTVRQELPRLESYLDASDINYAIGQLHEIVQKYHLPPKILVIHRFTRRMVTNTDRIRPLPDVQVVMNMDGWGAEWLKRDSYRDYIVRHPVEYTGFKIFYHNDVRKPGWKLMTPEQVLGFRPYPLYIQYQ